MKEKNQKFLGESADLGLLPQILEVNEELMD
jgi:hypothetical protein